MKSTSLHELPLSTSAFATCPPEPWRRRKATADRVGEGSSMALNAGTQLGPYEILALIGAGGMGEVYRATDTTLNRYVAITGGAVPIVEGVMRS